VQENVKGEVRVMEVEETARDDEVHALVVEGIAREAEQGASAAVENGMPHD
jgi:hypothetical protein